MFSITEEAEVYVADLFEQQDEKDLGLKVDVEKAGTPVATVTFNFCIKSDLPDKSDLLIVIKSFHLLVSVPLLMNLIINT